MSYLPLRWARAEGLECRRHLLGPTGESALAGKLACLREADQVCRRAVQTLLREGKLPRNWPAFLHRHFIWGFPLQKREVDFGGEASERPGFSALALVTDEERLALALSRQLYELEWQLPMDGLRLVVIAEETEEVQSDQMAVSAVQRYFGGLAHPERCVFGLTGTHALDPSREVLRQEILHIREQMAEIDEPMLRLLSEWNEAWMCRRDMEAAMVLTQAGLSIAEIQFGLHEASAEDLQREAARHLAQMAALDEPLKAYEAVLEKRFAAALGLVWWADPAELSDSLVLRSHDLARHVAVFEALAGVVPLFRELLVLQHAFGVLAVRMDHLRDDANALGALQTVVPLMLRLARDIERGVDGALYPFAENQQPLPLSRYLLPQRLPADLQLMVGTRGIGGLTKRLLHEGRNTVAPFVDRLLKLYHRTYGWLAETAELAEAELVGGGLRPRSKIPKKAVRNLTGSSLN